MKKTIRLRIDTKDRSGMVLDILHILNNYCVDIRALEVHPGIAYIKTYDDFHVSLEVLKSQLLQEKDVIAVQKVELLPQEEREKYIETVLDATEEGIIAVDKHGIITTLNQGAKKVLKVNEGVIGEHISKIIAPELPILETIKTGKSYEHVEIILDNQESPAHYVTSGRPILDEEGKPIGAVGSIRDIESVMDLVHLFTKPSMITFDEIIGKSEKIIRVIEMSKIISKSDSTVLIRGESGTGKELFARSIHMASPRKNKPFVAVNCAALPDSLLESELFGYEEGAFTGARKGGKPGLFKYADNGTIFLDEIGELSTHLQVKLLRVLQESKVRQLGSNTETPINVRVIAATNRDLEKFMENGQFREDLYYRLNVIPITVPPLRERKDDIPILCEYYIQKLGQRMNKPIQGISDEAIKKLIEYDWPGNIRELANIIERAMNLCHENIIQTHHLILENQQYSSSIDLLTKEKSLQPLKEVVAEAEKRAIEEALRQSTSIRQAAKSLGVNHATVINKMRLYGIEKA